jgi:hypothetical protein
VHPDFERLFGKKIGFSVSPVFGGKTSQAEFEVLCGRLQNWPVWNSLLFGVPAYCPVS